MSDFVLGLLMGGGFVFAVAVAIVVLRDRRW